ncbi:39487_t:CDS:2, partial [Gigaspora margarita]
MKKHLIEKDKSRDRHRKGYFREYEKKPERKLYHQLRHLRKRHPNANNSELLKIIELRKCPEKKHYDIHQREKMLEIANMIIKSGIKNTYREYKIGCYDIDSKGYTRLFPRKKYVSNRVGSVHFYFLYKEKDTKNGKVIINDFKADFILDKYTVSPLSLHPNGNLYQIKGVGGFFVAKFEKSKKLKPFNLFASKINIKPKLKLLLNNNKRMNNNANNENKGLVVAELLDKVTRKTKNNETFYILEISVRKVITEMVLELRSEESLTVNGGKEPFFVFTNENRNRFAYTLEKEENEEETITNRELLSEVKKRIKEGKISFSLSAVNNDNSPLEIDTDLKDNESNFRINLQENSKGKISRIQAEIKGLERTKENKFQSYKYFTEDEAIKLLKPMLEKEKLAQVFSDTDQFFYDKQEGKNKKGEPTTEHVLRYLKQVIISDGETTGQDIDISKAKGKAETYAMKYFLSKFWMIPVVDTLDPDQEKTKGETKELAEEIEEVKVANQPTGKPLTAEEKRQKWGEYLAERAKKKELTPEQKEVMQIIQKAVNEHLASNYHRGGYDYKYNTEIKKQSLILDEKETDDTKKKSKQLEKLLTERETINKEKQDKDAEIRKATTERKSLLNIASYVREAEKEET